MGWSALWDIDTNNCTTVMTKWLNHSDPKDNNGNSTTMTLHLPMAPCERGSEEREGGEEGEKGGRMVVGGRGRGVEASSSGLGNASFFQR